jgi:hypothetical protein
MRTDRKKRYGHNPADNIDLTNNWRFADVAL